MIRATFLFLFLALMSFSIYGNSYKEINDSIDGILIHIEKKISASEVQLEPFPHIVIENIFPDWFYEKIQKKWPDASEFVGSDKRKILPVTYGCIECTALTKEQKIFWRIFGEVIVNKYIKPRLIHKLLPFIQLKLNLNEIDPFSLNLIETFANFRQDCLVEDINRFSIAPHIDQLNIFAALLFYLPEDNNHQDYGTIFLKGPACKDPNQIYEQLNYEFFKRIPYRKNTLVCFLQSPFSWHSVDSCSFKNYIRKLYISPIFFSPEFVHKHYSFIYKRSVIDEYYFDHRFLNKENWSDIWSKIDHYK